MCFYGFIDTTETEGSVLITNSKKFSYCDFMEWVQGWYVEIKCTVSFK
jgi:hypothetical protein